MSEIRRREAALPASAVGGPASPLEVSVWLAAVLVGAKAVLLGAPRVPIGVLSLASASFRDVLFALAVGAAGEIAVAATTRQPALARALRAVVIGFCMLCASYGVVYVGVFQYFHRPLSYDLLRLGRYATLRSSITERITVPMAAALIGAPASFLGLAFWGSRGRGLRTAALAAASVWVAVGSWRYAAEPPDSRDRRLALNPHVELFGSTIVALTGARKPALPKDFLPEDTVEFRTFSARGGAQTGAFKAPPRVARPRNLIVIVLESVGTKYLSLYGSTYNTTPNLTAESANALVFDNFYAHASYTYYSFRAINFSIYPGLPWCYAPWAGRRMPPPLASLLRARGWRTAYLHNGDLDWGEERWLLRGSGYDATEGYTELGCPRLTSWGTQDRCLIERLVRWIDEKPGRPFLAVCWTDQTHDPYRISPGVAPVDFFRGKPPGTLAEDLSRYLNVLHETDRQLGRLFAALRERGLADDTLVVVTGDHGEAFLDPHDQRGHGLTVYQEEVNVPLVLWNPRLFAPGRRVATVGAHVDLNPTIADVLGVRPSGEWQGHSLFDPARASRAFFLTNVGEYLFGVREGQWKYIFDATGGREMLFDLSRDPEEQRDASAAEPERCRRLRQRIGGWVSFEDEFLRGRELTLESSEK